jgi:hypothetical protein
MHSAVDDWLELYNELGLFNCRKTALQLLGLKAKQEEEDNALEAEGKNVKKRKTTDSRRAAAVRKEEKKTQVCWLGGGGCK